MSVLVSYAFHAVIRCDHCQQDLHAGWSSSVRCHVCEHLISLRDLWKKFGVVEALQATISDTEPPPIRESSFTFYYRKLTPYCHACRCPIAVRDFTESAKQGWLPCERCHTKISVREVSGPEVKTSPRARWIVHETTVKGSLTSPVLFACLSCGLGIEVDGAARIVECSSCQRKNFIPSALWSFFHPPMQGQVFFVVYQFTYVPLFELYAAHPNAEVRKEAAAMQVGEEALGAVFVREREGKVLEVLAKNPDCSSEMLSNLSRKHFYRVRLNVAQHLKTPISALEWLAADSDPSVQEAARQNPRLQEAERKRPESQRATSPEPASIPSTKLVFQEAPFDADPYRSAPVATKQEDTEVPAPPPFSLSEPFLSPDLSPEEPLLTLGRAPLDPLVESIQRTPEDASWRQKVVSWLGRGKK